MGEGKVGGFFNRIANAVSFSSSNQTKKNKSKESIPAKKAFNAIDSSYERGGKKIFSLKRGGSLEEMWVKVKNKFNSHKQVVELKSTQFPQQMISLDYKKANATQIAAFIKATESYSNRGTYEVGTIFRLQGDRYSVYMKLYSAALALKIAKHPAGNEILTALKERINGISVAKRSKQLRELLTQIENSLLLT